MPGCKLFCRLQATHRQNPQIIRIVICFPIILSNSEILAFTVASGPEPFRKLTAWLPPSKTLSRQRYYRLSLIWYLQQISATELSPLSPSGTATILVSGSILRRFMLTH